jgi:hypothetical protein
MPRTRIWHARLASIALCLLAGGAHAGEGGETPEEFIPIEEWSADDGLTGDAIYDRMLDNRFSSYEQTLRMHSGDRGGNFQDVHMRVRYRNYREESERILSKTIAKYFEPQDVRHLGYLVINKREGVDDQFVYRPSSRKVRRINVRGEAIAGTDFAFEDIVPQEFEDGRHIRMADDVVGEIPTYVVAVIPRPDTESEYAKFILYLDREHYVPLRTVYWDNKRTRIKEMTSALDSISHYEDVEDGAPKQVWVATRSRMVHLKQGSFTELEIHSLEANPGLRNRDFSERELTASR